MTTPFLPRTKSFTLLQVDDHSLSQLSMPSWVARTPKSSSTGPTVRIIVLNNDNGQVCAVTAKEPRWYHRQLGEPRPSSWYAVTEHSSRLLYNPLLDSSSILVRTLTMNPKPYSRDQCSPRTIQSLTISLSISTTMCSNLARLQSRVTCTLRTFCEFLARLVEGQCWGPRVLRLSLTG